VWGVIVRFCERKKLILFREKEQIYLEFSVIKLLKISDRQLYKIGIISDSIVEEPGVRRKKGFE